MKALHFLGAMIGLAGLAYVFLINLFVWLTLNDPASANYQLEAAKAVFLLGVAVEMALSMLYCAIVARVKGYSSRVALWGLLGFWAALIVTLYPRRILKNPDYA